MNYENRRKLPYIYLLCSSLEIFALWTSPFVFTIQYFFLGEFFHTFLKGRVLVFELPGDWY